MAELLPEEARQTERKRVLKGAKISYAARCASFPCVVRDISDTGARLQVKDHAAVPETFELLIELDGFEAEVEVVWRKPGEIGVIFLTEPTINNPSRKQVVSSSDPAPRGTLRKAKTTPTRRRPNGTSGNTPSVNEVDATPTDTLETRHVTNAQVDALKTSLGTLEIAAGESVAADIKPDELPDEHAAAVAPDSIDAVEEVSEDLFSLAQTAESNDALNSLSTDTELEEDALAMDRTFAMPQDECDPNTPSSSDQHHDDVEQHVDTTSRQEAPQFEVPMFRDLVEEAQQTGHAALEADDTTDMSTVEQDPTAEVSGEDTSAADVVTELPDVHCELNMQDVEMPETGATTVESASSLPSGSDPISTRIASALQASNRAAENLIKPVVPIIPVPEIPAELSNDDLLDAPSESDTPLAQDDVSTLPDGETVCEDASSVSAAPTAMVPDVETQADTTDTVDAPEHDILSEVAPVAISSDDLPETAHRDVDAQPDVTTTPLRPDLADFVQMFAPAATLPAAELDVEDVQDLEDAPSSLNDESDSTSQLADNVLSVAESTTEDATSTSSGDSISTVVESLPTHETETSVPSPSSAQSQYGVADFMIVEESIIVESATPVSEPNFCEMQIGTSTETEVDPAVPAVMAPEQYKEVLPCADADNFVLVEAETEEDRLDAHVDEPTMDAGDVTAVIADAESETKVEADLSSMEEETTTATPAPSQDIPILIAEDDPDDRMFMREAFSESAYKHDIAFVENGQELLDYLNGVGEYEDSPRPGLILLDLNMPKMDGRTALLHIKANPSFRRIPVIVMTTSNSEDDIDKTYDLGVSSYISKPSSAEGLKEVITTLNGYWSNVVALPNRR